MKLVKDGIEWVFPEYSGLVGLDFSARNKGTAKALQHGAILSDDGKIDGRNIDIEVIVDGQDMADYFRQTDDLKRHIYQTDQKLYITDDRYINVAGLVKYKESFFPGFYLVKSRINITLLAIDPFIYSDATNVVQTVVTASPKQFTINNPGNIDTPTTITITATGTSPAITLKNLIDSGRLFSYQDVQMTAGQILVIDAITGTVQRGEANTINNFGGTFLNLLPGDNMLEYTGGPCIIEVSFKTRWL